MGQSGEDWLKAADKADKADKGDKAPPSSVNFEKAAHVTAKPPAAKKAPAAKAPAVTKAQPSGVETVDQVLARRPNVEIGKRQNRYPPWRKWKQALAAAKEREYQAKQAEKHRQWRLARGGTKEGLEKNVVKDILNNIKEDIMKKEIKESQLRNMIRGVIQEMFEEDLNETTTMDQMMKDNALDSAANALGASNEDLQSTKGHFSDNDSGAVDYETDAMEEDLGKWLDWCSKRLKMPRGSPGVQNCAKKKQEKEKAKNLKEDSGEEEKENYKKNVEDDKEHLKNLEKDIKDDEKQEKLEESFFPKGRSTREKARKELNESLMKRWGFTKKEK